MKLMAGRGSRAGSIYEMAGRGSRAGSIYEMALLAVGAAVAPRVGSLKYRLRWPGRIIFSTRNLRL